MEWLSNVITLPAIIGVVLTGLGWMYTLIRNPAKKRLVQEVKEAVECYNTAKSEKSADGKKITKAEQEELFQELLDVLDAIIALKRRPETPSG